MEYGFTSESSIQMDRIRVKVKVPYTNKVSKYMNLFQNFPSGMELHNCLTKYREDTLKWINDNLWLIKSHPISPNATNFIKTIQVSDKIDIFCIF